MEGHTKLSILMLIISVNFHHAKPSNTKEARKVGLLIPEKIIGGVIDIVHSHKHKPSTTGQTQQQVQQQTQVVTQQNYQPQPGYQPQYPNYQYPPAPNQGAYQSQYQSQLQNSYNNGYQPQGGGNYPASYPPPSYPQNPAPVYQGQQPSYGNTQSQSQGQYQGNYLQNQGQYQNQNQQSTGQYQNQNQNQQQISGQYNQNQQNSGQYQNVNQQITGQYQNNNQNQQNNQFQGSSNQQSSGQFIGQGSGGQGGGFQISAGHQSGGPGPTCVCQAWTKPESVNEVPSPKGQEKSENSTAV
ncbi:glutenin, high molecular weight subunit PW212-like [Ostrinia furnacalis]|uniref:glutenin, high molecular weight subunit PW212-like n=1 Tax=Ostrinia furnacalis TaxID=93504 RepID=UPI00103B1076|nr:glutenin, high molecular weight subunit PW212-like [Ostrinia furnacalis]